MLERARKLSQGNPNVPEVVEQLEVELNDFQGLWREFQLLLRRVCGLEDLEMEEVTGRDLAVLIVLRARISHSLQQRRSIGVAQKEETSLHGLLERSQ